MCLQKHSFKTCGDFNSMVLLLSYKQNKSDSKKYISHIWLIPSLLLLTLCIRYVRHYLKLMSHIFCDRVSTSPVPVEKWSGQVECWWGLRVAVSWRSGTATEPASEPRSAGESSAAAHSHCEPRPCLKKAQVRGGFWWQTTRAFLSWSHSPIYCMEFRTLENFNYSSTGLLKLGYTFSWEDYWMFRYL